MKSDFDRVLFSEEQIKGTVKELGCRLSKDYEGLNPLLIGVLKGSFIFMADLIREMNINCEIEFMAVSSYGSGSKTTGAVKITQDLARDIEGRNVIVIEDILDSGLTLRYLLNYLQNRRPASLKICTLLDKPECRIADVIPDYVGQSCPNEFVVGYGLDYAERYRNLPYIAVLSAEVYSG